jgi:phosphoglycolate phosphatase
VAAPDITSNAWPRAVLFDLDGTLIDSAADIAAAANALLALDGLGPLDVAEVRAMVGNGVRKLVERAYAACGKPVEGAMLDARHAKMMDIYRHHLTNHTTLMPGAREAVQACRGYGARIAVITNKPEGFSREILAHFGLTPSIDLIVGGDTGPARKPAPDMLLYALAQLGVAPGDALMVGDGSADIEAARAAGVPSVAVEGGYSNVPASELGAARAIASLAELPGAIAALKAVS